MDFLNIPDTWIPATTKEWHGWLANEERKTANAYLAKPDLLIAHSIGERGTMRDYEGREILELLQNANDQAAEVQEPGKVLIELSPSGLIVANTGLAFSVGGVSSLLTSHLSPKRRRRKLLIGSKGLGFRAVLNWSRTPIIVSGALRLAYSLEHAWSVQKWLMDQNPELAQKVQDEASGGNALVLPLLPFPLYAEDGDLSGLLKREEQRTLLARCQALVEKDYVTAVAMPFSAPTGHAAARAQTEELRPEILLFAEFLKELCFRRDGEEPVTWERDDNTQVPTVFRNKKPLGKWNVRRCKNPLPQDKKEPDQAAMSDYEVVVAVPGGGRHETAPLFSHFPTDVQLPLPIVCHATLELEQNRKHIQQNRTSNSFVLGELAKLVADTAEALPLPAGDAWARIRLLMPLGDYPVELVREDFHKRLIEAAKLKAVVPTLGGACVLPKAARIIPGADVSWLPADAFSEVIPSNAEVAAEFLVSLGASYMDVAEVKRRIIGCADLTLERRVALIAGLLGQPSLQGACTSSLLLDTSCNTLAADAKVFLPPSTGDAPTLPGWVDMRFLNEEMRVQLARALGATDGRELQRKLSGFGLLEYSLANVVQTLVRAANLAQTADPQKQAEYQADLLRTLFQLFNVYTEPGKRPEYPPKESRPRLPRQGGGTAPADSLYLGTGFGPRGEIVQALYADWMPQKLVDEVRLPHLSDDDKVLREFLLWIGVAQWPRNQTETTPDAGYLPYVLQSISYPARFGEKLANSPRGATDAFCEGVQGIDGLGGILDNAGSAAIVAWLAADDRSASWGRADSEHAILQAYPEDARVARRYLGKLPSYVRWKIETSPWLQRADGLKCQPKECVIGDRAAEGLFPRPGMPDQDTLNRYGLQHRDVFNGWSNAGVLASLAQLSLDEVYAMLLGLPQRSPDGKLARTLYDWLLESGDTAFGGGGPNRSEFLAHGKMWGGHGNESAYFPTNELRYVDAEGLPAELLQRLKVVDLPKGASMEKVKKLFGVRPVDRAAIQQTVIDKELALGWADANADFQAVKPYLHRLRASQNARFDHDRAFRELLLEVCSMVRAELSYEGQTGEVNVPMWGWLIVDRTLLVRADPTKRLSIAQRQLAEVLGAALASVFRVSDGGQFARVLSCPEEDRLELLVLLGCESVPEDIESLNALYDASRHTADERAQFPVVQPDRRNKGSAGTPAAPDVGPQESTTTPAVPEPPAAPQVVPQEHTQAPPPARRELRITGGTPSGGWSAGHRVTDGSFCEKKAMEFEEADNPPRFPLLVSHVLGYKGPKCDILSFASKSDHDSFVNPEGRNLGLVARFIEVKGRSDRAAVIELKDNEYDAALRYGSRYYLYRLYEHASGEYHIATLANPLRDEDALQPVAHVSPERARTTKRFTLLGGVRRTPADPSPPGVRDGSPDEGDPAS